VSAHINDTLMACKDLAKLAAFKKSFLTRFLGTDEGEVTTYLGCELIRNRAAGTITFRQSVYAQKILMTYGMWDCVPVRTPLEPGTRLTKEDCPLVVDPVLHRWYWGITGHL
jgi:hypothetical protein